uniref:Uncharacterized protein n=1 Tax=Anguilla anguilla TaxID=7936 RepID=A0A0E9VIF6_ANGAN
MYGWGSVDGIFTGVAFGEVKVA